LGAHPVWEQENRASIANQTANKPKKVDTMAVLQVTLESNCLLRKVTLQAILPVDRIAYPGAPKPEEKPLPTLYLLHGMFGSHTDWIEGTRIVRFAMEKGLAVIMPAGENHFYVDCDHTGEAYGAFIGEELPALCRRMFPLSPRREDTAVAGLSMGGYGAIRNGLKYAHTFGHAAGLSSAFVMDRFLSDGEDESGRLFTFRRPFYRAIMGDLEALPGSDKDVRALALSRKAEGNLPRLYLACGTDDGLLEPNRAYARFLKENDIPVTYEEGPGGHDWTFWDTYIRRVLDWLP